MNKFAILLAAMFLVTCGPDPSKPAKGFLEISLTLNQVAEVQPSYQTVIWLESNQGEYIRSLYVSEYLSYGGFHDSTICTTWSKKAGWDQMPQSMFDLVTHATPPVESTTFRFSCQEHEIRPGTYRYKVQTHLVEKFNIAYTGSIKVGGKEAASIAQVSYIPGRHPDAKLDALTGVTARYVRK